MNLEKMLKEELEGELGALSELELGAENYKVAVDGITKLYDRLIETQKLEVEINERSCNRESDEKLKRQQMADANRDNLIKNMINVVGIVVPIGVTIWGTLKAFEFEKEGTVTTLIGRGFIQKLLPKK